MLKGDEEKMKWDAEELKGSMELFTKAAKDVMIKKDHKFLFVALTEDGSIFIQPAKFYQDDTLLVKFENAPVKEAAEA